MSTLKYANHSVYHRCINCAKSLRDFGVDHNGCFYCSLDLEDMKPFKALDIQPSLAYKRYKWYMEHLIINALCYCEDERAKEVTRSHVLSAIKNLADIWTKGIKEYVRQHTLVE